MRFRVAFHHTVTTAFCIALCLALGLSWIADPMAQAAPLFVAPKTINVNTLVDKVDANDGKCSLREAMQSAFNADNLPINECPGSQGNTIIKFAVAGSIVISGNLGGMPDTRNAVTLIGPITIDATNLQTILFDVEYSGKFSLVNVTIKNAKWTAIDSRGELNIAGGLFENNSAGGAGGGAIRNDGTANIAGVEFKNNKAVQKDSNEATKAGGAIRTTWVLTVTGSTFTANVSDHEGGAIAFIAGRMYIADSAFTANVTKGQLPDLDNNGDGGQFGEGGGAISLRASGNTYPVTIKRTSFQGNAVTEGSGGAIFHDGGTDLTIQETSFQGNHAGTPGKLGAGGAIRNKSSLIIKRSMFIANSVEGDGGAISNDHVGQLKLRMVGFTGNNASGKGGAIANMNFTSSEAKVDAIAVAINGNIAGSLGGGIYNHDAKYDKAEFRMTVFAGNLPQNCRDKQESDQDFPPNNNIPDSDEVWPIDSKGQNSFSDDSCDKPEANDEQNPNPQLGPPAINGSSIPGMLTQQPLPGSPLIDKIPPAAFNPNNDPDLDNNQDARGLPRQVDGNGDGIIAIDLGPIEKDEARAEFNSLPIPSSTLDLGNAQTNQTITKTDILKVYNSGGATLSMSNVSFGGAQASEFTIVPTPSNIGAGGAAFYDLTCRPTAVGVRTATLTFNTNDVDHPSVSYTVKCTGVVAATPGLGLNPPPSGTLSVSAALGTPRNFSIGVNESGNAQLTLSNVFYVNEPPGSISLNTGFPINIANGGAATSISFTCNADSIGLKTGTLKFNTNDPAWPSVTVYVSCDVIKPVDPLLLTHSSGVVQGSVDGLYGIAQSPDGRHVYVADYGDSALLLFDANTISLSPKQTYASAALSASERFTNPYQVAVSPDGAHVYVSGVAGDSIVAYARNNEDGTLTWVDTVSEGDCTIRTFTGGNPICLAVLNGLDGAYGMAFSPDGKFVYVSSINDSSVVVLGRNTITGNLSGVTVNYVQRITSTQLSQAYGIAMSPDGSYLYATSYNGGLNSSVLTFKRNSANGTLSQTQVISSGTVANLAGVFRVLVSQDGAFVYTASFDSDAVCAFSRNASTGALTPITCYADGAGGVVGLVNASDIAISPDGKLLVASAYGSDGVVAFRRNLDTGRLTFANAITRSVSGLPRLDGARGVIFVEDGKRVLATGFLDDALVSLPIANPRPVVNALMPASRLVGSASFTLTVGGDDFVPGATVLVNGSPRPTEFVNRSQLKATISSLDLTAIGVRAISVNNPSPSVAASNALTLAVVASVSELIPAILEISVQGLVAGNGPVTLEVLGSDFAPTAVVLVNGSPRPTTFVDSTRLQATLPASDFADDGDIAISVSNVAVLPRTSGPLANGVTSTPLKLVVATPNANPPPSLNTLSQTSIAQLSTLSELSILITGMGFMPETRARFDGAYRPTQYLSPTQIRVTLSMGDLVDIGNHSIDAVNPTPGGGESNVKTFTVLEPNIEYNLQVWLPLIVR